jgi:formylmethanofuran--tetrahydromethanopterin N-formyltransferase
MNRETGQCQWEMPHGEFQNTFTTIQNTFAEMFQMWVGRVLITAANEKWALTAATVATGFASSIIMSPAEAGIESLVPAERTPDKRVGALVQFYHRTRPDLKSQMILRIGQCVMTCPTTAAYDALPSAKRHLKVGRSIRLFGDGYQRRDTIEDRSIWRIPVMEGEFIVEETFGAAKAIAGGNFLIMAENRESGLKAAEEAANAIHSFGSWCLTRRFLKASTASMKSSLTG